MNKEQKTTLLKEFMNSLITEQESTIKQLSTAILKTESEAQRERLFIKLDGEYFVLNKLRGVTI
jgi:hypothetical protein